MKIYTIKKKNRTQIWYMSFLARLGKVNLRLTHAQDPDGEEKLEPVRVYHVLPVHLFLKIHWQSELFAHADFADSRDP